MRIKKTVSGVRVVAVYDYIKHETKTDELGHFEFSGMLLKERSFEINVDDAACESSD